MQLHQIATHLAVAQLLLRLDANSVSMELWWHRTTRRPTYVVAVLYNLRSITSAAVVAHSCLMQLTTRAAMALCNRRNSMTHQTVVVRKCMLNTLFRIMWE